MAKLRSGAWQQGVLANSSAVAAWLRSPAVGVGEKELGQLFVRCPALFSWPPEQCAAMLFGELLGEGLTAGEAARCFVVHPKAMRRHSFAGSIDVVTGILAHSKDSRKGPAPKVPADQLTVATLLRQHPRAIKLLSVTPDKLRRQVDGLAAAGCPRAGVAKLTWHRPECLWTAEVAEKLAGVVGVLQQELGLPAAAVVEMLAGRTPVWLSTSVDTLRERAEALAQGFGKEVANDMVTRGVLCLDCDSSVWRCNLAFMAACGVADPPAVMRRCPTLLIVNSAAPDFVARRLLTQRYYGLSAPRLYERHAHYLTRMPPDKLAQRLEYVERTGQLHRLPAGEAARLVPRQQAASATQRHQQQDCHFLSLRALMYDHRSFMSALHTASGQAWDNGASTADDDDWQAFQREHPAGSGPVHAWAGWRQQRRSASGCWRR